MSINRQLIGLMSIQNLADCKKEGRTPAKPYSGKLTLRVSPGIHAEIAAAAAHAGKSLNKWIADTLDQVVH